MTTSNLTVIEKTRFLRATRERIWRALTTAEEFSKWFGVKMVGKFEPGARVQMTSTHKGYEGIAWEIIVEKMEPERLFTWRWHPGLPHEGVDYSKEPMTLVEFRLEESDGGTTLTVVESGFDHISLSRRASDFAGNEKGWELQMESLAQYVSQA